MVDYSQTTLRLRSYYDSGATQTAEFRKDQLRKLKKAILHNEQAWNDALYSDLNKPPEEAWVTEIGFVLAEIKHAIGNLDNWMRREKVSTNLLNFPSRSYIYKEPLGVVLIIGPWNYPFQLLLAPLVGAIAAGNCVVVKPSEMAPATSSLIAKIIAETFPPEYVSCVEGEGSQVVSGLMKAFRFDHIFFTGSIPVGKKIYQQAAEQLVPVTLELGGKSPCIVEEDANISVAAKRIALTKFSNAGQMCVAPDYVLVHEKVHDELVEKLKIAMHDFYSAEKNEAGSGKIVNERAVTRLTAFLQEGTIVAGGKVDEARQLISPTLITDISPEAKIMQEEIFGPVLPVIRFKTFADAKKIIGLNPDPLAFYVFTESSEKENLWLRSVPFGGGCVNNAAWHLTNPNLPFGGRGNSGIGAYHGKYSFHVFSHSKSVMKTPTWFDPALKYPPFKGKLKLIKKLIG